MNGSVPRPGGIRTPGRDHGHGRHGGTDRYGAIWAFPALPPLPRDDEAVRDRPEVDGRVALKCGLSHEQSRKSSPRPRQAKFRPEGTWQLLASVFAVTVAALASLSPATAGDPAAGPVPAAVPLAPAAVVVVEEGRVTVDARDADLAEVLSQLGARAEFQLTTMGQLGRVTTAFTAMSVEQALRRLAADHELMLVYGVPTGDPGGPKLIQVGVFAAPPSAASVRAASEALGRERAAMLAEIHGLARSRNAERDVPRLAELLGFAPDPIVRARAASALGGLSSPLTAAALVRALTDQVPYVRVRAVHALRRVEGARAIPALGSVLLADPDGTVRRVAAQMLGSLPEAEATAALSAAAHDADGLVRREISRALNRRGISTSP